MRILQLGCLNKGDFELAQCSGNCEVGELQRKTGREQVISGHETFLFLAIIYIFLGQGPN